MDDDYSLQPNKSHLTASTQLVRRFNEIAFFLTRELTRRGGLREWLNHDVNETIADGKVIMSLAMKSLDCGLKPWPSHNKDVKNGGLILIRSTHQRHL